MVIKYQGRKVGVASRVGKSYVLDMPIESAMPVELVTDHQEGVKDRQEAFTDPEEAVTDRETAVYAR
jgi:hypothetical protein